MEAMGPGLLLMAEWVPWSMVALGSPCSLWAVWGNSEPYVKAARGGGGRLPATRGGLNLDPSGLLVWPGIENAPSTIARGVGCSLRHLPWSPHFRVIHLAAEKEMGSRDPGPSFYRLHSTSLAALKEPAVQGPPGPVCAPLWDRSPTPRATGIPPGGR